MSNEKKSRVTRVCPLPITHNPSPQFSALPPLALYIHIPWCVRKCLIAISFARGARRRAGADYISALTADLDSALPLVWSRRVYSVFFGGGTPSLFSSQGMDAILSAVRAACLWPAMRDHPRGESRHLRSGEVPAIPRGGYQPAVDRHPEFQSRASPSARPHPRRARGAARDRNRETRFR